MQPTVNNDVKEIAWQEKTFLTIRKTLPIDKLTEFFSQSYGSLYGALAKGGIPVTEPPCAIYYSVDQAKMVTDLAAAIPFQGKLADIQDFEVVRLPASKALTITHFGSYDSMGGTYSLLDNYAKEHGLMPKWMIEQYLSDPQQVKDPAQWMTNVYYVL